MIRSSIHIFIILVLSWGVYAYCQNDHFLAIMAGLVSGVTLLARGRSGDKKYAFFEKIPLSGVIIFSFFAGMVWRNFVPVPENSISPFPEFIAALQSGSIIASILLWLRPHSKTNMYRLVFCAWLTVPLSLNVPLNNYGLIVLSTFCFTAIAVVIFNTRTPPTEKKYFFAYIRDYFFYSTLLIMMTMVLFLGIARSIVAAESAFFNTMSNYILPRNYTHFLRISSQLNLITPGTSAFDRRPVMEVDLPPDTPHYLKMQVFDDYKNGTWKEPQNVKRVALPLILRPGESAGRILMFTFFKDLVPAPETITAVKARFPYLLSENQILYSEDKQNTRIMEFSLTPDKAGVDLSPEEYQRSLAVPAEIASDLKAISSSLVEESDDVRTKANKIAQYLRDNFSYSLDVDFSADDRGLIKMLREKRPAYCTYFASALALLLRAEGIPARIAAGFYTSERINRKNNTYLVRVNNAHAWTEVYAPFKNPKTHETIMLWRLLDATPSAFSEVVKQKSSFNLDAAFESLWLSVLRFKVKVENMDKDQVKFSMILGLMGIMAFLNRREIFAAFIRGIKNVQGKKKVHYKSPDSLRVIYGRYEAVIKEKYGETRRANDTDADVIERIKGKPAMDQSSVTRLENFVREFHAVRFGSQSPEKLKELIKSL